MFNLVKVYLPIFVRQWGLVTVKSLIPSGKIYNIFRTKRSLYPFLCGFLKLPCKLVMGMVNSSFGKTEVEEEESSIIQLSSDSSIPCNADIT